MTRHSNIETDKNQTNSPTEKRNESDTVLDLIKFSQLHGRLYYPQQQNQKWIKKSMLRYGERAGERATHPAEARNLLAIRVFSVATSLPTYE